MFDDACERGIAGVPLEMLAQVRAHIRKQDVEDERDGSRRAFDVEEDCARGCSRRFDAHACGMGTEGRYDGPKQTG